MYSAAHCFAAQSSQTLTRLFLLTNRIGDAGAEHLAAGLKVNRVRETFFERESDLTMAIVTDTERDTSRVQPGWGRRYGVFGRCVKGEPGEEDIRRALHRLNGGRPHRHSQYWNFRTTRFVMQVRRVWPLR